MKYACYGKTTNIILPFDYDENNPDIVLSFGGDGTMLGAIHKYKNQLEKIKFVGINTGKLGFYTDFVIDELNEIFCLLKEEDYDIFKLNLMEYCLIGTDNFLKGYAVNDLALINPINTQIMDIYINGKHFETIRGTGVLISPPGGSTAYNKSLGGSIIDPFIKAIQLTEVAPINNRVYRSLASPMVLSEKTEIELRPHSAQNLYLTVDGEYLHFDNLKAIKADLSDKTVSFIVKRDTDFFDRVKRAFIE
ncbi:MAG: NAD kinase [Bacilli bacterium]|nr:NAD kinase [Bacilli bacterium]MDD4077737.1 NAD kinase [Bacilli bacterium]